MIPIITQNADINARAADFPDMQNDELLITSTFATIQGEGPLAGERAFFIRTSGCNFGAKDVACSWCDTSFAIKNGKVRSFISLLDEIKASESGHPLVVLTGGEPLLQENTLDFIKFLLKAGCRVQVETNGSFLHRRLSAIAYIYPKLFIVISPKQLMGRYASAAPGFDYGKVVNPVNFKFVVSADPESPHHELPAWVGTVHANWWVSPMTVYKKAYDGEVSSIWDSSLVDQAATAANYGYAARLVMDNPRLRFTCQLHTLMAIA